MNECNSIECNSTIKLNTYYQRNKDVILHRAKYYYENDNERLRDKQEINTEAYLKKKTIKSENMEKISTTICLMKKRKD